MRYLFSPQLYLLLVGGLIGLFFVGNLCHTPPQATGNKPGFKTTLLENEEEEEDEAVDGDRVYPDRPDLAQAQDAALTRDPRTGTVPRERLLVAARYNNTALARRAQQRTTAGSLAAATWTERGPSNIAGRILALLVDPADATGNTVWAGAAGGGLWKGTNASSGAVQWQNVNSSLTSLAVTTIAATPGTSPQVMYCGTGEGYFNIDAIQGAGIWKSNDGGATWAQLASTNNANFYYVQKIVVHPVTNDLYAATRTGLWRSQNAGTSWSQVLSVSTTPATTTNRIADLEIGADNTLYAAVGIFATDGIYRSPNGDAGSWTKLNTLANSGLPTTGYQRIELACAPSDATRLYAVFQSSASGTPLLNIYRSSDSGTTWVAMSRPGATATNTTADYTRGQAWYNLAAAVSPADPNTVYVGGIDLWATNDAGNAAPAAIAWIQETDWTGSSGPNYYAHSDHHAIAFVPTTTAPANQAYFGGDGGIAYSADASLNNSISPTFSERNNGLNVTQLYAVAMHPTNYNYFLAGAQDNGTQKFTVSGLNATSYASGGDGGFCAIDQSNPAVQISSYVYNQYFRSVDGGNTFQQFFFNSSGQFINPFDYDSRSGVLYAAYSATTYLAWTNAGTAAANTATTITPSLGTGTGTITHVTVSPLTANRIYVGTNAGRLLRVDNANTTTPTVTTLRTGVANTTVSCVAVDPTNEKHLLVTYANYGTVSVFESLDADVATPTWTSVEGALPDMPVRWALFDPRNTTRALLATEMGVYATDLLNGSSTSWAPPGNGLVNTRVDMLRYRLGDQLVAAATHGRGLFTSDVFKATASAPLPVRLLAFTGTRTSAGVVLNWQTASEQNSRSFEVEESANGRNFRLLGSVAAAGTSTALRAYKYTDASLQAGLHYYRLRQVDLDATSTYSPVVAVRVSAGSDVLLSSAYPNPFSTELNLELGQELTGDFSATLMDALGHRVFSTTLHPATRQLTMPMPASLAPGSYVLTVRGNGQQSSRHIIKQ